MLLDLPWKEVDQFHSGMEPKKGPCTSLRPLFGQVNLQGAFFLGFEDTSNIYEPTQQVQHKHVCTTSCLKTIARVEEAA